MPQFQFPITWLRERGTAIVLGLILVALYLATFAYKSHFEIEIETTAEQKTNFKVYWAPQDRGYLESRSSRVRIRKGLHHLKIPLGNLDSVRKLRIDPIEYAGRVTIKSIGLSQSGYKKIQLEHAQLKRLKPLSQIESIRLNTDGLIVDTADTDGNLEFDFIPEKSNLFPWTHLTNALLIMLCSIGLRRVITWLVADHTYVVVCMTSVVVMIATMAMISSIHVHPDERVHLKAIEYYANHFLPPAIDSPEIKDSFSDYGKSRLSTYELYYPFAGFFSRIISPLDLSDLISARVLGVLLFLALLLLAVARPDFRLFALPLVISPQIWYLYSYPNSDGFALMVSMFIAYQLAVSETTLNRFLGESRPRYFVLSLMGFGLLAGTMLLSKVNFYFYLLFLLLYLLWRLFNGYYPDTRRLWVRVAMVSVVAVSMFGGRYALDVAVNGPNPQVIINQFVELNAKKIYRPSTPMEKKHVHLYMKQRGNPLDVVMSFGWAPVSFATSFGSFGYTQYFGSDNFFSMVSVLLTLLLTGVLVFSLIHGPPSTHVLISLACFAAILLLGASIWSSWTENFQPQGRYLAPIIPMMAIVLHHVRTHLNPMVIASLVLSLYAMSVYSFVYIGLGQISKTTMYTGVG